MANYVLTCVSKALVVFEAGTAQGLSAAIIAYALRKNSRELGGVPCKPCTIDILADRSFYIRNGYDHVEVQLLGDSVETLQNFDSKIDLFIHDSINDPSHNSSLLRAVGDKLSPGAVLHTSWFSREFIDVCPRERARALPFKEVVGDHWYTGRHAAFSMLD